MDIDTFRFENLKIAYNEYVPFAIWLKKILIWDLQSKSIKSKSKKKTQE